MEKNWKGCRNLFIQEDQRLSKGVQMKTSNADWEKPEQHSASLETYGRAVN